MTNSLISYRHLSLFAAALCLLLCIILVFTPALLYWLFGIAGNAASDFMAKRTAMLFLGLSIITFTSRNETRTPLRQGLCLGVGVAMAGLATMGIYEFVRGFAGAGIWLAILAEAAFAALYFREWKSEAL